MHWRLIHLRHSRNFERQISLRESSTQQPPSNQRKCTTTLEAKLTILGSPIRCVEKVACGVRVLRKSGRWRRGQLFALRRVPLSVRSHPPAWALLSIAHYILQPSLHLQLTAFDSASLGFTTNSVSEFCSKKSLSIHILIIIKRRAN